MRANWHKAAMPEQVDIAAPPRIRLGAALLALLLHLAGLLALIRAFAPDLASRAVDAVVSTFAVEAPQPSPSPEPPPPPSRATAAAGAAGTAGRRAVTREVAAPAPRVAIARTLPAPPVAATGRADSAGARDAGQGTGAGGTGLGTGSGGAGNGQGAGGGPAVKTAGEINSARDYPAATRDLRIGGNVVIALTVGTDGRPTACRVVRPSRDAEADAITCRLALARFRFRPATDAAGQPVESTYGWQQRWFYRIAE